MPAVFLNGRIKQDSCEMWQLARHCDILLPRVGDSRSVFAVNYAPLIGGGI